MADPVVIDASTVVDLVIESPLAGSARARLADHELHAPAHLDAEVLSALGRLSRAGELTDADAEAYLADFLAASIERHSLAPLVEGAWARRHNVRVADAIYLELSARLEAPLVTTDRRLHNASPRVELLTAER